MDWIPTEMTLNKNQNIELKHLKNSQSLESFGKPWVTDFCQIVSMIKNEPGFDRNMFGMKSFVEISIILNRSKDQSCHLLEIYGHCDS